MFWAGIMVVWCLMDIEKQLKRIATALEKP